LPRPPSGEESVVVSTRAPIILDEAIDKFLICFSYYRTKSEAVKFLLVEALMQYLPAIELALKFKREGFSPKQELSDLEELALSFLPVSEEELIELRTLIEKSYVKIIKEAKEERFKW